MRGGGNEEQAITVDFDDCSGSCNYWTNCASYTW